MPEAMTFWFETYVGVMSAIFRSPLNIVSAELSQMVSSFSKIPP